MLELITEPGHTWFLIVSLTSNDYCVSATDEDCFLLQA